MHIRLAVTALLLLASVACAAAENPCGVSPGDWCPAPANDPCGRHADVEACKKDKACYGRAYRGESAIACQFDERGFGLNCPTVGCTSEPPKKPRK